MHGNRWGEHNDVDDESFVCHSCDQNFSSLKALMYHKKEKHRLTWPQYDDSESTKELLR